MWDFRLLDKDFIGKEAPTRTIGNLSITEDGLFTIDINEEAYSDITETEVDPEQFAKSYTGRLSEISHRDLTLMCAPVVSSLNPTDFCKDSNFWF